MYRPSQLCELEKRSAQYGLLALLLLLLLLVVHYWNESMSHSGQNL